MVIAILGIATCQGDNKAEGCSVPAAGSKEAAIIDKARGDSSFTLLYPCFLPNSEDLVSSTTTGTTGRQRNELVFNGPYDLTIRQSQYPPPVAPDPAGTSRTDIDLFSNVRATFLQQNDGSQKAMYHLFWVRNAIYYELQAFGPPIQQRQILEIARSLQ